MKLNLGCGRNHLPGYVNVDKEISAKPDIVADLEESNVWDWQWLDGSVDEIRLTHVLEHFGQATSMFLGIMRQMYRVLKPGGQIHIKVPHPRSEGFIGDPTHVRPITPAMLMLFSKRLNREWEAKGWPNTPLGLYCDVDFELVKTEYTLTPYWQMERKNGKLDDDELRFAMDSYFNVIDEIYMILEKVAA